LGFFIWPQTAKAADPDIVISEIGAYETSDQEWLEIFNKGAEQVDLTGWKFYEDQTNHKLNAFQNDLIIDPGEYAIIANVADKFKASHPDFSGAIIDSSWSSLKESGEEIGLKNSQLDIIELFTYLACPNTSLQRIDESLNDYTVANWQVHAASNSAGRANEFPSQNNNGDENQNSTDNDQNNNDQNPPADNQGSTDNNDNQTPPPDNQNNDSGNNDEDNNSQNNNQGNQNQPTSDNQFDPTKIVSVGSILINEFVSDPADGEVEWIELYNTNLFDVDLTGWKILDGAETETTLNGIMGSNPENHYFVIEKPKGRLNNAGDAIILKNKNNDIIDAVYYGNWKSPNPESNAPVANDPNSVARIFDGANTWNNKNDFVITTTPTKDAPNIISLTEEERKQAQENTNPESSSQSSETKILINELYPNPPGSDLENEFIELKNAGLNDVDLNNWQIKNTEKQTYKINGQDFTSTILSPNQFLTISRKTSKLVLNNRRETIKLLNTDDKTIQTVKYSEDDNVTEDTSYALDLNNNWVWTTTATPNEENIINPLNHAPEIEIYCPKEAEIGEKITCDASDSYDPDNDPLNFSWVVEDQENPGAILQHQFQQKGSYKITLNCSDGQAESKETQTIKIKVPQSELDQATVKISSLKTSTTKTNKNEALQGLVSVLPNTFAKNLIYLAEPNIQVYLAKGDWPKLQLGDLVSVFGTTATSSGEQRIKLAGAQDIQVLNNQKPPEPKVIKAKDVTKELVSGLVQISGRIIKKESTTLYLQDETGRAIIYLKPSTKINKDAYSEGQNLTITGILKPKGADLVIYPRSSDDIVPVNPANPEKTVTKVPANYLSRRVLKYLIASFIFLSLGLALVFYKSKRSRPITATRPKI